MGAPGRRFVIVSGLPGSGKSRLAVRLAPLLQLPVIDKDDILEGLFQTKGAGDSAWRRALSRESDLVFQRQAEASEGALLVSFWRVPGMPADSGTPTEWLAGLSNRLVHLCCECLAEVAAYRFHRRARHPGHLDHERSHDGILQTIRDLALLQPLAIGERFSVDTAGEIALEDLAARIAAALFPGGPSTSGLPPSDR
jgi:glucokinase